MKTRILFLISAAFICNCAVSQNRITTWDCSKITAIRAEFASGNDGGYCITLTNPEAIDSVLQFLRETEFREYDAASGERFNTSDPWIIRLTFTGQRDWIYFWQDHATVGKTLFTIDKKVVRDVKKIITHCKKC